MIYPLRWAMKTLRLCTAVFLSHFTTSCGCPPVTGGCQKTLETMETAASGAFRNNHPCGIYKSSDLIYLLKIICCFPASHKKKSRSLLKPPSLLTVGQSQAVTVPDGDVHNSGGGHLLNEFGSERRGFGGTAAKAGPATPRIHLKATVKCISTHLRVQPKKKERVGQIRAPCQPVPWRSRRGTTGFQHTLSWWTFPAEPPPLLVCRLGLCLRDPVFLQGDMWFHLRHDHSPSWAAGTKLILSASRSSSVVYLLVVSAFWPFSWQWTAYLPARWKRAKAKNSLSIWKHQ